MPVAARRLPDRGCGGGLPSLPRRSASPRRSAQLPSARPRALARSGGACALAPGLRPGLCRCVGGCISGGWRTRPERQKPRQFSLGGAFVDGIVKREFRVSVLCRPGSDLLSRVLRRSTISAEEFNGRVRNGIGFRLLAMTTRPAKHRETGFVVFVVDDHLHWKRMSMD